MKIEATTLDAYKLIHEGVLALARAERQGFHIDVVYCERKKKFLTKKIDKLTNDILESDFFAKWKKVYGKKSNIESGTQLAHILYVVMKIKAPRKTAGGGGSTDEEALSHIKGVPELSKIIEIRKLRKLRDTYLDAFLREQQDGYIHPFYNLHTVVTYRSSSDSPNFQNLPKRDKVALNIVRRAILPRPGHMLMEADFSGLEVSISACYHQDPTMLKYLFDPTSDMHSDMAAQIFFMDKIDKHLPSHKILRQAAKNGFVFPQFYGDYYGNNARGICEWVKLPHSKWKEGKGIELPDGSHISDHLIAHGLTGYNAFVEHMKDVEHDFWFNRFPVYNNWKDQWVRQYQEQGHIDMYTGFTCRGVMRRNEVINYPVQGSASHCEQWSFNRCDEVMREEKWDTKLLGSIHDSIIFDVLPSEKEHVKEVITRITCKELAENWKWIIVPLSIDIDEYGIDEPWIMKD